MKPITLPASPRILVVRNSMIGNSVLDTPVFRILSEWYPGATIDVVADRVVEKLLAGNPFIRRMWFFSNKTMALRDQFALVRSWRQERYDICVNMTGSVRPSMLTFLAGIPVRIGFSLRGSFKPLTHTVDEKPGHVSTNVAQILSPFERDVPKYLPELFNTPASERSASEFLDAKGIRRFAVIHPAGNTIGQENWNLPFFVRVLAEALLGSNLQFLVVGTPDEIDRLRTAFTEFPGLFYADGLSVDVVSAIISRASVFLGNDSGPAHIAEAWRVPKIVLYRDDAVNFSRWSPLVKERACVIFHREMAALETSDRIRHFAETALR